MKTKKRLVKVAPPSFPDVPVDSPLQLQPDQLWQVVCGDRGHWRLGIYSPAATSAAQLHELERHDCAELFVLLEGRVTLLLAGPEGPRELALSVNQPVLVTAPHSGFCPDHPHGGRALVVERDAFTTEYRPVDQWSTRG